MSGMEALAIAGCVFGLIQAYDAAERTVSRIKARRQAHKASQPSVYLEKSLEQGKRDIENLVKTGRDRFGPDYLSDSDKDVALVQNALLQITNQTYLGLLERLAEAREDDAVVDFSDCIDAADRSRMLATNALNEYFLMKLREAAQTAAVANNGFNGPAPSPPALSPHPLVAAQTSAAVNGRINKPLPSSPEPALIEVGRKVDSNGVKPGITSVSTHERPAKLSPPKQKGTFPRMFTFRSRKNSNLSTASTLHESPPLGGDRPVSAERLKDSIPHESSAQSPSSLRPINRRSQVSSDASSVAGHSLAMSLQSPQTVSRRTSFSSMAPASVFQNEVAPISKYGGCCKSAYLLREGKQGKAFTRRDKSAFSAKIRTFVFVCSTVGCEFEVPAIENAKKNIVFDDRVRQFEGMRYTFKFLAKSHATKKDSNAKIFPEYRCLFCNLIGFQSQLYSNQPEFLSHVLTHAGITLGKLRLEGGIVVNNSGLERNGSFDVDFPALQEPEIAQRPGLSPQNSDYSNPPRVVDLSPGRDSGYSNPPRSIDLSPGRNLPTSWLNDNDPEVNHWAREGER